MSRLSKKERLKRRWQRKLPHILSMDAGDRRAKLIKKASEAGVDYAGFSDAHGENIQ